MKQSLLLILFMLASVCLFANNTDSSQFGNVLINKAIIDPVDPTFPDADSGTEPTSPDPTDPDADSGTEPISPDPTDPASMDTDADSGTEPSIPLDDNSVPGDVIINEVMADHAGLTELPET
ncbi:MAG: hypothetical protein LBG28_07735, partial [Tannerella sp.]|nr:hypothetical protein [Tannerella sp.]